MPIIERSQILAKFKSMIARREPIIGGGAGTGLSAKWEEAGGIDLIIIYNNCARTEFKHSLPFDVARNAEELHSI